MSSPLDIGCPLCLVCTFVELAILRVSRHFPLFFQQCFAPKGLRKCSKFPIFGQELLKINVMEEITDKVLEALSKVDGIIIEDPNFNLQEDSKEENLEDSKESDKPL